LFKYRSVFPNHPILDIGMGIGRNALYLAENGFNVTGVDISQTAIDTARKEEVLSYFQNWKTWYCAQTYYWDHDHESGDGHYHDVIVYLGQNVI
jgi:2-polyprenyl-3-methyl-5-hydroxy-6-metoxy-1,4-benzoquinol methylase